MGKPRELGIFFSRPDLSVQEIWVSCRNCSQLNTTRCSTYIFSCSLACPERKDTFPPSIAIRHSHIESDGKGIPEIVNPHLAAVTQRASKGNTLATGMVFEWCDGYRSTIADALNRTVQGKVDILNLVQRLIRERNVADLDEELALDETLRRLESQHGALLANYGDRPISTLCQDVRFSLKCKASRRCHCDVPSMQLGSS